MYVMLGTRSDLAFVVGLISRYLSNPSLLYWQVVKRNLSYIKGTLKHHMYYQRSNNMQLHGYSNANYTGNLEKEKSTISSHVFTFCGDVSWGNKK